MQRRAELGRISLFTILKKFQFDASGKVATGVLLPIFSQASLESQERAEASKHSPASDIIRCMSLEHSTSSEHRGRRSRRLS
jgi:hypothetical protein